MSSQYRMLLQRAQSLNEKHRGTEQAEPFSVFSVLCNERDEVNLHSRFLKALLEHHSPDSQKLNLKYFIEHVLGLRAFDCTNAIVKRESLNIDILITTYDRKNAVVIENKIDAGDQPEQLIRYRRALQRQGYATITLVYLTLDGRDPSPQSIGKLSCIPISYRSDLLPWLNGCKKREERDPSLRESIAQYIRVVRKLVGDDLPRGYMTHLVELCKTDNNLILIHELGQAAKRAHIDLLHDFWDKVGLILTSPNSDLPERSWSLVMPSEPIHEPDSNAEPRIEQFIEKQTANIVLRFPLNDSRTGGAIGADHYGGVYCGVYCPKKHAQYDDLTKRFQANSRNSSDRWAWYSYEDGPLLHKNPTRETLAVLLDERSRHQYAKKVCERFLDSVWASEMQLTELISRAPWREAVTYRDTWPHEYVMIKKDGQRELFDVVRSRMSSGEGLRGRFFNFETTYLFVGEYKYWFMTPYDEIDLDSTVDDFVLNRAQLYRDRRDFLIQPGDTGRREDYPEPPRLA